MASLLTEYFTEMVECVFRTAARSTSSWATRSWPSGARPSPTPDDPDRAVHAAIDMMHALDALNDDSGAPPAAPSSASASA